MMIYIIMWKLLPLIVMAIISNDIGIILSVEIIVFDYNDSNKLVMVDSTLIKIMLIKRIYK